MKIVGLTGGIGSGKSTVAKFFEQNQIPVYNSDWEAKKLMNEDEIVKNQIIELFGENAYQNNQLNRKFIADQVFVNKELLAQLNQIVHPAVQQHFLNWVNSQNSDFVVKEAAILFESGAYKSCDFVVTVAADEEIRIQRVIQRDEISPDEVKNRIQNQWSDAQRMEHSDFVIYNNAGLDELYDSFQQTYQQILAKIQN